MNQDLGTGGTAPHSLTQTKYIESLLHAQQKHKTFFLVRKASSLVSGRRMALRKFFIKNIKCHITVFTGRDTGSISGSNKNNTIIIRAAKVHYELCCVLSMLNMLTYVVLAIFL